MLNKKEKARLDEIEKLAKAAYVLNKTQKMRNDDLMLKNAQLEEQLSELRSRLRVQNADV